MQELVLTARLTPLQVFRLPADQASERRVMILLKCVKRCGTPWKSMRPQTVRPVLKGWFCIERRMGRFQPQQG